jgi:uncharacterized protein (TIGR02118 family)
MVRLIFSMHRLASLEPDEFRHYWFDVHAPLVSELAADLRLRKYVQAHPDEGDLMLLIRKSRGLGEPLDGVAELWWDSVEDMVGRTPAGASALARLAADEQNFIDLQRSFMLLADDHVILA